MDIGFHQPQPAMTAETKRPTTLVKHSIAIAGHATSVSLEAAFWSALKIKAARDGLSVAALVASIDAERDGANLSSAIRVFLFLQRGSTGS